MRKLGVRTANVIRIDSACSVSDWLLDPAPAGNTQKIASTFKQACDIAADYGERLAAEGEICWGGMHSWQAMLDTLDAVDRPDVLGFQADMAHTLLYALGENADEHRLLDRDASVHDEKALDIALKQSASLLRNWTIDFHVAQNDGSVKGMGSHDKTGRHCLADDPEGVLDIPRHAGYWLRNEAGELTRTCQHLCWDGCMFPNEVMHTPDTWNNVLAAMLKVREQHGWVG